MVYKSIVSLDVYRRYNSYIATLLMVFLMLGMLAGSANAESSGGLNVTLSPNSSTSGSTVNMNFTVNDANNAISWFNFTFPSIFNIGGASVSYTHLRAQETKANLV